MDRWERLFADLDRPLLPDESEVAELVEAERASVTLASRLRGSLGSALTVCVPQVRLRGTLEAVGKDWLLLRSPAGIVLVMLDAVTELSALGNTQPAAAVELAASAALRRLARRGARVVIYRVADTVAGQLAAVAADHVEVRGETGAVVVPFAAITAVAAPVQALDA